MMEEELVVSKSRGCMIPPSAPTPSGVLQLSVIDSLPVLRCDARTLHVFRGTATIINNNAPAAVHVIRKALSKALVPYYPLAGRLLISNNSDHDQLLQISCSGEGIWFVEASTTLSLDDVDCFQHTINIPYDKLLPHHPSTISQTQSSAASLSLQPLVLMQVTQFACGGFVIGLTFCHSICDGLGAAQFLNAVGELAKGLDHPTITPLWCRDFFPPLPLPQMPAVAMNNTSSININDNNIPPPSPIPTYRLEHANIDVPLHKINHLKTIFQEMTGRTCSAFEVVAASLWIHRTRSITTPAPGHGDHHPNPMMNKDTDEDDELLKLVFFANCRQLMNPPLPNGFYGNCFFPVTITAGRRMLLEESSIADVVKLIQEAKGRLPDEVAKWTKGELLLKQGIDPFSPPLVYTTLFISEWGRLGFNKVDYGWGPPVHIVPVQGSAVIPVGIVCSLPSPNIGLRLMTWCVEKPHLKPFLHNMTTLMT